MLTGKQRSELKRKGRMLDVSLTVGKAGIIPTVVTTLAEQFRGRELIKLSLPKLSPADRAEMAASLAEKVQAQIVGHTGRTWLLYRENPEVD